MFKLRFGINDYSLTDHSLSAGGAIADVKSGSNDTSYLVALHVWQ